MLILRRVLTIGFLTFTAVNGAARSEHDSLAEFEGVWIGRHLQLEKRPVDTPVEAVSVDLAIWKTDYGFSVSWKSLDSDGAARFTGQFVAAGESDTFEANQINPASADFEKARAQIEGNTLSVYLSQIDDEGIRRIARYDYSLSNGIMRFDYTLSSGSKTLERLTGTLSRAKVVM